MDADHISAERAPLINREAERQAILNRLKEARNGQGAALAIEGKSGLGKSRLAREAAAQAQREGVRVAFVPCRGSTYHPDQPLVELARALLDIKPDLGPETTLIRIEQALGDLLLPDLIPAFIRLFRLPPATGILAEKLVLPREETSEEQPAPVPASEEDSVPPSANGTADGLGRAFGRVLDVLTERSQDVLIIVDDLDQASERAQAVISRLIKGLQKRRLLLLATFSPEIAPELRGAFGGAVLTLDPLPREQTAELGATLLKARSLDPSLAGLLWKHTAGNPLLVIALIEVLQKAGRIKREGEEPVASLSGDGPLPEGRQIIPAVVNHLPTGQRLILACASVLGDGFRVGALKRLSGQDYENVEAGLLKLMADGWLEKTGEGRYAIFRFSNRLAREALYHSLPEQHRASLHRQAGDYYATPLGGYRLRIEQAIHHYLAAEDPRHALGVIELALAQARRQGDLDQVVTLYQRGIELAATDRSLTAEQARFAEALGDIYVASGDYKSAAEVYELGLSTIPLRLLSKLGLVLLAVDPARAVNILMQVTAAIPEGQSSDLHWRLEAALVWALALSGRAYEATRRSRDALGVLGDTVGFGAARTLMRGTLGMVLYYQGDPLDAHSHLESARAGWGARGEQEGVMLINQVLIAMPKEDVTRAWLRLVMHPLLTPDARLVGERQKVS